MAKQSSLLPLNVAFLWHQHQPYYKNAAGYYQMPWVRFHGTKDYLDLLLILREFPQLKQTVNLVPSLLWQLQDYVEHQAKDNIWLLTEIPADRLGEREKRAILDNFFLANAETMIHPYPRYHELYLKRERITRQAAEEQIQEQFTTQDFLDLQVWYNLTWIGPITRQRPPIQELFQKGRHFTEADKQTLMQEIRRILAEIIPLHRELWEAGQIELTTSPFYHPILPLLIDSTVAKESTPEIVLPVPPFKHPEDAQAQIRKGLEYFESLFGRRPAGMWPSEGSVSEAAALMIARHHLRWIATDEAILIHSLPESGGANRIYRPYRFQRGSRSIVIFFRDHQLSDAIGFVYSGWEAEKAVEDFISRLCAIRKRIVEEAGEEALRHHLVSVILDGENCWEFYPENGLFFLRALYRRLSVEPRIRTVTFSEFLDTDPEIPTLPRLFPGSWINHNFNIWIGAEEDNRAWQLLQQAHEFLERMQKEGVLTPEQLEQAWEHLYIAEGSDWCWWYGDEHTSAQDLEFDELFRQHLMQVYEIAGQEIPVALYQTIKHAHFDRFATIHPKNLIHPVIDGRVSHFYEWVGAAEYDASHSPQTAMHQVSRIMDKFYVGFDRERLYLRADFLQPPEKLYEYVIAGKTPRQMTIVVSPLRGVMEKFVPREEAMHKTLLEPSFKLGKILEIALPFRDLELAPGDMFGFQFQIKQGGQLVETFPHTKIIEIEVPDRYYELREWWV